MGATLTHERRTYSCRLYAIDPHGYVRCGACWKASGYNLKDCRSFHVTFDALPLATPSRRDEPTSPCETCGADPGSFSWFEDEAIVAIEYTPCRIF